MLRVSEKYLIQWFNKKRRKPLIIRGARQVGKTELVRCFSKKNNFNLVEINLEKHLYLDLIFKTLSINKILKEIEGLTHSAIKDRNTLLFLDEIQATPYALQALRYFYEEKPNLAVIAAGSLLEFTLKDHNFSMPVGRIEYFHLGPLTFKEFLKETEQELINPLENFKIDDDWPESLHRRLTEKQREYLFVGGMPEAVLTYSETNSLEDVSAIHESILNTYNDDFSKYAKPKELMLLQSIFNQIPKQISNKIKYSNFSREQKSKDVKYCLDLLAKARICSPVFHSHCSGIPIQSEIDQNHFKLLFLDTGLANHQCGLDWLTISSYNEINLINEGSLAEQFIGQHLLYRFNGLRNPDLFYWLREGKKKNAEVDFVFSQSNWIIPVEVKSGKKGSLKSLFQFFIAKKGKIAIRFDLNKPSFQEAEHIVVDNGKKIKISFPLLSLPLYMVEETTRLINEIR